MTPEELKAIERNTMTAARRIRARGEECAALAAWDKHNAPTPKQEALL